MASLAVCAALAGAAGCSSGAPTGGGQSLGPGEVAPVSGDCVAQPGQRIRGIEDDDDDYEAAWPHKTGQETTVYFAYGTLPQRYAGFVRTGAEIWSRSPCIRAVAVPACPSGGEPCSTVTAPEYADEDDRDTDGNSTSTDRRGVRISNELELYRGLLDDASETGALATTVHEMGHALGLMHRTDKKSVMYPDTIEMTSAQPDEIDYANLVVMYGGGRPPGD